MDYYLYTDGGANSNPGPAGIGAVLLDAEGQEIDSLAKSIGNATNNQAEYLALINGLELVLKHNIHKINLRLDSELLVKQILGEYQVKNPELTQLKLKIDELLSKFEAWSIQHIPREQNQRADDLSKQYR